MSRSSGLLLRTLAASGLAVTVWSLLPHVLAGARPAFTVLQVIPGLTLAFRLEPLGMLFALVAGSLWLVNSVYSIGYMWANAEPRQTTFYLTFAVAIAATIAIAFAANLFTLFVFYELLTLTTYPLVTHTGTPAAMRAGRVYLGLLIGTSMLLLLPAIVLTGLAAGTLDFMPGGILDGKMSPAALSWLLALFVFGIAKAAVMPTHFWLPAAMVAPTPVSALLHAGVVNLGGFVLIRFAPLLEQAPLARTLLVALGLGTAVLAGLVMLTRISIKVRLAWSTVAQMGFLALECGLGLYTLAALHLIGHSLYKAHAFLAASSAVRYTRLQALHDPRKPLAISLWLAPLASVGVVLGLQMAISPGAWPLWWGLVLGLAWAPLLWLPTPSGPDGGHLRRLALSGLVMVTGLTGITLLAHTLPLNLQDAPHHALGAVALAGMAALYLFLVLLHTRPNALEAWRRRSYAGFYLDEHYTRLTLRLWPTRWTSDQPPSHVAPSPHPTPTQLSD